MEKSDRKVHQSHVWTAEEEVRSSTESRDLFRLLFGCEFFFFVFSLLSNDVWLIETRQRERHTHTERTHTSTTTLTDDDEEDAGHTHTHTDTDTDTIISG